MSRKQKTITYLCPQARQIVDNLAKANKTSISDAVRQLILNHVPTNTV